MWFDTLVAAPLRAYPVWIAIQTPQTPARLNNNKGTLRFMMFLIAIDVALGFSRPIAS
jgi:hypothetical protein